MRHMIHTCEHCQSEYLIDLEDGSYDVLVLAPDLDEGYEEDEITAEAEPGCDGGMTINQMIEQDDDDDDDKPGDPRYKTDPEYRTNTNTETAYANGTPMVPGKTSDDGKYIENKPVTRYNSGIRVETNMSDKPPAGVRQQRRKFTPTPPGNAKPFAPKRKKLEELTDADHSREGFEVSGGDATQDFTGLTGAEAHHDNLLQQAYESDLRSHGF